MSSSYATDRPNHPDYRGWSQPAESVRNEYSLNQNSMTHIHTIIPRALRLVNLCFVAEGFRGVSSRIPICFAAPANMEYYYSGTSDFPLAATRDTQQQQYTTEICIIALHWLATQQQQRDRENHFPFRYKRTGEEIKIESSRKWETNKNKQFESFNKLLSRHPHTRCVWVDLIPTY